MEEIERNSLVKAVGQAIAARRTSAGLSQEKVAEHLGISREAVSRIETGVAIPNVVRLAELAEIFDCGIEELLTEASNRELDQARKIVGLLGDLTEKNRDMLLGVIRQLVEALSQNKK